MSNATVTLSDFQSAFDASDAESTVVTYRDLDAGDKARARAYAKSAVADAMRSGDFDTAKEVFDLAESLSTPVESAKVTVDPAVTVSNRIATLRYAADLLESGQVTPEGIDADTLGDLAEGTADEESAHKIAGAKITRSGVRRSIGAHVAQVFEGRPSGSALKVSEVANLRSEEYGDSKPSSGAIAAHFAREVEGFTFEKRDGVNVIVKA
jgi:hypothetical protein